MENMKKFTKKLNILCIEDEELARNKLVKFLKQKFKSVDEAANGIEGLTKYNEKLDSKESYDLIISDINMPKMDGLELLKKIRQTNKEISIIFITARSESDKMIEAIEYQVNGYILKPIDFDLIAVKITEIANDIYYKRKYAFQKKENEDYIALLNKQAIVSKTDLEGNITFVNDAFCEVCGYSREELIGKSHNIIRHPDVSKSLFQNVWETISNGEVWEGRIKNKAKNGSSFFLNTKIIPLYDEFSENISEYIAIRFVITDEESRKREFNKKVIESLSKYKKYINDLKQEKRVLTTKLSSIEDEMVFLDEKNRQNTKKIQRLLTQVEVYEKSNLELDKVALMSKQDKQKQFDAMYKSYQRTNSINESLMLKIEQLKKTNDEKIAELAKYEQLDMENKKRIEDLKDLVSHFQKEIEKEKAKTLNNALNPDDEQKKV